VYYIVFMSENLKKRAVQSRAVQTRDSLVRAALREFAEQGFGGASTRAIAKRAGVAQSALPYHFSTKEALWRAAADRIFDIFRTRLDARRTALEGVDASTRTRLVLIDFVRLVAEHPELHLFMLQEGAGQSKRLEWLVATHARPFMLWFRALVEEGDGFAQELSGSPEHAIYMLIGAASTPYALAPEFKLSTDEDPFSKEMVEAHAEAVVGLFLKRPNEPGETDS
jgi:TetR/AcrR family transcriptional regulator